MELYAVFETWHLGDGNYPALERGMLVNLSFEIEPDQLQRGGPLPSRFEHLGAAEYDFSGEVLRVYRDDGDPLIVIAASSSSTYSHRPRKVLLQVIVCRVGAPWFSITTSGWSS
jgi:hypothetical protein